MVLWEAFERKSDVPVCLCLRRRWRPDTSLTIESLLGLEFRDTQAKYWRSSLQYNYAPKATSCSIYEETSEKNSCKNIRRRRTKEIVAKVTVLRMLLLEWKCYISRTLLRDSGDWELEEISIRVCISFVLLISETSCCLRSGCQNRMCLARQFVKKPVMKILRNAIAEWGLTKRSKFSWLLRCGVTAKVSMRMEA